MSGIQGAGNLTAQITPVQSLAAEISSTGGLAAAITVGAGELYLESVTRTYTPTEEQQTEVVYPGEDYDGIGEVDITVGAISSTYVGSDIPQLDGSNVTFSGGNVSVPSGFFDDSVTKAMPAGTAGTPTATKGTVSNHAVSITPSVTNTSGYITGSTINGTPVTVSASELVSGTYNVASGGTVDVTNYESISVPTGSAGTPTATMGTISNHSISVTPSVTNITGYITGSTINGTAVSVSASELVSGTYNVTSSGTKDVTNYESISVSAGTEGVPTATKGTVSNHSVSITPSVTNVEGYIVGGTQTGTAVTVTASELVSGTYNVTSSGTKDVTNYASASIPAGSATPADTISASGAAVSTGTNTLTFSKSVSNTPQVTEGYVSSGTSGDSDVSLTASINTRGSSDLTVSGDTVTAPAGYYGASASKSVASGTAGTPTATKGTVSNHSVSVTPSVTNTTGYITGDTKNGTAVSVSASELVSGTYSVTSGGTKDVTNYESINVPSGTEGTPSATKGTVSNHSVSITPSVTNVEGYINGGTHTGTGVSVSANELVSGTKTISANGTGIDVTNYASVDVAVPSGSPSLQTKSRTYTPTTSQQTETVQADSGYDGLDEVNITVNAMPTMTLPSSTSSSSSGTSRATISRSTSNQYLNIPTGYNETAQYYTISATPNGTVTAPSSISGTGATVSTGTNTLTLSKSVSVTPDVTTAGYISSGTAGNSSVSLTANVTTKGATTYNTSTTDQTISASQYLTGTQTIKAVTVSGLSAENIASGVTVKVGDANDDDRIASVTGSLSFVTYYTGSSTPSSSLGNNGDIYLKTS